MILLRSLELKDRNAVAEMLKDKSILEIMPRYETVPRDILLKEYFSYMVDTTLCIYRYAIEVDKKVIGVLSWRVIADTVLISYFISSDYRNKGIMKAVLNKFITTMLSSYYSIYACVLKENIKSSRLLEILGFTKVQERVNTTYYTVPKIICTYRRERRGHDVI